MIHKQLVIRTQDKCISYVNSVFFHILLVLLGISSELSVTKKIGREDVPSSEWFNVRENFANV